MLDEIHIKDLALIEEAHIKLGPGLNVLTGETGAGKTIVVEAVGLLLGERADVSLVRTGRPKAEVQGLFVVPVELTRKLDWLSGALEEADELLITRVLSADGKSKCYVNGRLVTVGNLAELGSLLIDLHGQHEHQSLFKTALHLDYLDRYAADSVLPLRSKYTDLYRSLNDSIRDLKELESKAQDASARRDLLEFQIPVVHLRENLSLTNYIACASRGVRKIAVKRRNQCSLNLALDNCFCRNSEIIFGKGKEKNNDNRHDACQFP